jgi:hypothetical protein
MPRHGTSQSVPAGSMRGVLDLLKESGRCKAFFALLSLRRLMPRHGTSQSVPAGSMRGVLDLLKESGRSKVFFLLGIFTGSYFTGSYAASWNQPVCSGWFHDAAYRT